MADRTHHITPVVLGVIILALGALQPASAQTTYYVNGTCGNDDWTGLSPVCKAPDGPKATIQAGIDAPQDGDTVLVADGIYTGLGNVPLVIAEKRITVRSENGPQNCIIDGGGGGGGILFAGFVGYGTPVLDGFSITNMHSAAIIFYHSSSPTITNCIITGNSALRDGGGIYSHPDAQATITNCTITGNTAGYDGGGIYSDESSLTLINCTIAGNTAGYDGGGIYSFSYDTSLTMINCTIMGNTADRNGGGIFSARSDPTISNTILWGNTPQAIYVINSNPVVTYSDVQGGWPGEGNIDEGPLFVPGPVGCYYLGQTAAGQPQQSPCVDAGDPGLPLIDGTTRSDEVPDSGIVDMGYHYPISGLPLVMGDHNRDGDVDFADFAQFQMCFTGAGPSTVAPCCRILDFEPDEDVDLNDFAEFLAAFTGPL